MLVLRRKVGEVIVLDEKVIVSVLEVEGNRVKLGISAPPGVSVVRQELLTDLPAREQSAEARQIAPDGSSPRMDAPLPSVGSTR